MVVAMVVAMVVKRFLFSDPVLIGHLLAAPYTLLEPDLYFILTINYVPCGYILGTRDYFIFFEKCVKKWFPEFCECYPHPEKDEDSLEANFIRYLHQRHIVEEGFGRLPFLFYISTFY